MTEIHLLPSNLTLADYLPSLYPIFLGVGIMLIAVFGRKLWNYLSNQF